MAEKSVTVRCPTCESTLEWSQHYPYRPFCSRRCKLIDLGAWLDGSHHIPGAPWDDESLDTPGDSNDEPDRV
ncbi:MAG: DNA gyrase inhibitor YacG [Nitrococcus sp.]|nr:DNA gyrase inhibitor YacG [Nitrococcus sp.]